MKIFSYEPNRWADTKEFGFVLGPEYNKFGNKFVAEDGNRPGDIETFDSVTELEEFCRQMNSNEGTCYFQLCFDPEIWSIVQPEIEDLEAQKNLKDELKASQNDEFWFAEEMRLKGFRLR